MRNLFISNYLRFFTIKQFINLSLNLQDFESIEKFYYDEFTTSLFAISTEKIIYQLKFENAFSTKYQVQKQTSFILIKVLKFSVAEEIKKEEIVIGFYYILEMNSVIILLKSGDIYKFTPETQENEMVGSLDSGVVASLLSPSQEFLLVASNGKYLQFQLPEFDILNEKEYPFDNVLNVSLEWKPDGKLILFLFELANGKQVRIFDAGLQKEEPKGLGDGPGGIVQSIAEIPKKELQMPISWQTTGSFIAGWWKGENQNKIIFFEKNCLIHAELMLEKEISINAIKWNKTSEILVLEVVKDNQKFIDFYVRSNYKWYIKQRLQAKQGNYQFFWSKVKANHCWICYENHIIEAFELNLGSQVYQGTNELTFQLSKNLNSLYLSIFSKCIKPPPFYDIEIIADSHINCFTAHRKNICAITDKSIEWWEVTKENELNKFQVNMNQAQSISNLHRPRNIVILEKDNIFYSWYVFNENEKVYFCECVFKRGQLNYYFENLLNKNIENLQLDLIKQNICEIDKNILTLTVNESESEKEILLQLSDGVIKSYKFEEQKIEGNEKFESLPAISNSVQICQTAESSLNETILINLTDNQRLFYNNKLLCTECTSFFCFEQYLFVTVNSSGMYHQLYCFNINNKNGVLQMHCENLQQYLPKSNGKIYQARNIERGSKIIAILNEKLIFQLPRGNLETIYPRTLVLKKAYSILKTSPLECFKLLRQHKFDLNLLYDLSPTFFCDNLVFIMTSIGNIEYINLFLNSLSNDIDEIALSEIFTPEELEERKAKKKDKEINLICEKTIEALTEIDKEKYILCILTAYIRKTPAELEFVLNFIRDRKNEEINQPVELIPPHLDPISQIQQDCFVISLAKKKYKPQRTRHTSNELLEYVCWLADSKEIYQIALATYDLELAAMVAKQTQKDPLEYVPYLEALEKISNEIDKKVKINKDLKRFEQAIVELAKSNEQRHINEALLLIQTFNIYKLGLSLFENKAEPFKKIQFYLGCFTYYQQLQKAQYYQLHQQQELALQIYVKIGDAENAVKLCKEIVNYEKLKNIFSLIDMPAEKIKQLQDEFLEKAINISNYLQAGLIYLDLQQYSQAIQMFLKGNHWNYLKNTFLMVKDLEQQNKVLQEIILPGLKLSYDLKYNYLCKELELFKQKKSRLAIVQKQKQESKLQIQGLLGGEKLKDADVSSEMSYTSKQSYLSVTTIGGSKKRVPKNLKTRNVKEGSQIEEDFLVETLNDFELSKQLFNDYEELVDILLYFNQIELATKLYKECKNYMLQTNDKFKLLLHQQYETEHPELKEIYQNVPVFTNKKKQDSQIIKLFEKFSFLL